MKHILLITPFVPSQLGAGVNYSRQLIEELSKENLIDIVLFRSKMEAEYIAPNLNVRILKEYGISKMKKLIHAGCLFFFFPLFTAKFSFFVLFYLKSLIKKKHYDFVYFDFSQMFLYAKFLNHGNKILMSHDVIAQRYSRGYNKYISKFCSYTEKFVLSTSNVNIFTFSEKDSELLQDLYGIKSTPTTFYLSNNVKKAYPDSIKDYFVFFAMWGRNDNYEGLDWFIEHVMPKCELFNFKIIGAGLNDRLKNKIALLKNVDYLGFVDNPYPIIADAKALISPLFTGAGVKVKVIDALACGTPIIGTSVSFEGISDRYSDFMFLAKSDLDFLDIIESINIPLSKRIAFKNDFISNYDDKSVVRFING